MTNNTLQWLLNLLDEDKQTQQKVQVQLQVKPKISTWTSATEHESILLKECWNVKQRYLINYNSSLTFENYLKTKQTIFNISSSELMRERSTTCTTFLCSAVKSCTATAHAHHWFSPCFALFRKIIRLKFLNFPISSPAQVSISSLHRVLFWNYFFKQGNIAWIRYPTRISVDKYSIVWKQVFSCITVFTCQSF